MGEFWDIYDINRNKIGRRAERDVYQFKDGEYHIVVTGVILNHKKEILISKRAEFKRFGGLWECNSGSILAGESSLEGVLSELREELGVEFTKEDAIFLQEVKREKKVPDFKDLWLFQRDINICEITFPDGEATEAKWVTIEEFMQMYKNKEIVPTIDFDEEKYKLALKKLHQKNAERYYSNTESDIPTPNVKYFLENCKVSPKQAIDLGCGAGNDTVYLINNGWDTIAIDKENVAERISKRLKPKQLSKFKFQNQRFEEIKLEKCNLLVANYSLSFCPKEKFEEFWKKINNSIEQNGYFVGNCFGRNDSWSKDKPNMRFFTKDEVISLFSEFEIINFKEVEKDGTTGLNEMKHWHLFIVIAKKK